MVVVINPVCQVRGLRYLCHHNPTTKGLNTSDRDSKHIPMFYVMISQHFCDGSILFTLTVFIRRNSFVEFPKQVTIFIRLEDIPHLGFASQPMFTHVHIIVRVYLNTQVIFCVNELYKQRKLSFVLLIDGRPQYLIRVFRITSANCRPTNSPLLIKLGRVGLNFPTLS